MKLFFMTLAAFAALNAYAQSESNSDWELVSKSQSGHIQFFFNVGSESSFKKDGGFVTETLFSRTFEGKQDLLKISVNHRSCAAKHGVMTIVRTDGSGTFSTSEFAIGRPKPSVADGVALHLCNTAMRYHMNEIISKSVKDVNYAENKVAVTSFDSFFGIVSSPKYRGNKDLDELTEQAHELVVASLAAKGESTPTK